MSHKAPIGMWLIILNRLIRKIDKSLHFIKNESKNKNSVSAMLIIGREKGTIRNITVAGPDTFLDEMWQLIGGVNIFSDLSVLSWVTSSMCWTG